MKRLMIISTVLCLTVFYTGCDRAQEAASGAATNAQTEELANTVYAISDLSVVNHHEMPDVDEEIGCQSLMGTVLEVLEENGGWYRVRTPEGYVAWVAAGTIAFKDSTALAEWRASEKLMVTARSSTLYAEPSEKAEIICDITLGDLLIKGEDSAKGFAECFLPSGRKGYARKSDVVSYGDYIKSINISGESIVSTAKKFTGVPYVWGWNCAKGMDCSGFTQFVYHLHQIMLPRNASAQAVVGEDVSIDTGTTELIPGDLLFFCNTTPGKVNHVGIYIGNGEFIHSGTTCVKINSIDEKAENYYAKAGNLFCARRIIPEQY